MLAQSDWWRSGLVEAAALLLAAALGAWLASSLTKKQTLELHKTRRRQDALLALLDHLSSIRLALEKSLGDGPPQSIIWVDAAEDLPAPMVRQVPGASTWELSDRPEEELAQWSRVALSIYEAEKNWRGHLAARVAEPAIDHRWQEINDIGFRLALKGASGQREAAQRLRPLVSELMEIVRDEA